MTRRPCCSAWDDNPLRAETSTMHARLDAYPVAEGHTLVIPRRHVDRFADLDDAEVRDLHLLIQVVCDLSPADDFTIAVNDGPAAGRTIDHLHVHVIPRRPGDVGDPRGGIRRVLIPDHAQDPWACVILGGGL